MPRGTGILPVGLSPNFNRRWYHIALMASSMLKYPT